MENFLFPDGMAMAVRSRNIVYLRAEKDCCRSFLRMAVRGSPTVLRWDFTSPEEALPAGLRLASECRWSLIRLDPDSWVNPFLVSAVFGFGQSSQRGKWTYPKPIFAPEGWQVGIGVAVLFSDGAVPPAIWKTEGQIETEELVKAFGKKISSAVEISEGE